MARERSRHTAGEVARRDVVERVRPALVPVQALALAALLWPGRHGRLPRWIRAGGITLAGAGAALAATAAARMGRDLTPVVDPREGARLHTSGVFAISRHPIYTGMLIGAAGWTAWRGRREPLVAAAVLALALHLKAGLEERRLRGRFGAAYQAYARRTPRLLGLPRRSPG